MATKTRKIPTGILPALRTDDAGQGPEPHFDTDTQPSPDTRKFTLVRALGWYSTMSNRKLAKDWLLHYAQERGVATVDLKTLKTVHEREYDLQLGALARLAGRGLVHTEAELARIGDHLKTLLDTATVTSTEASDAPETEVVSNRPNIQEIMRDRAREAAGDLEGLFDDYATAGCPQPVSVNVMGVLTQHNVMAQHVGIIIDVWTARRAEFEAVQDGDPQLKEGYSQYTKIGMRNMIKFVDAVLAGLQSYSTVKKAAKAPRKKKAVPVEKLVAKVKYLKTFKDDALKLDLVSLHPSKLVGASEAFFYDTAKRKLVYVVADSHAGSLGVKGTTLLGFDAAASGIKTVRKPAEIVKKLMAAGKPASRKVFTELTTTHAAWNGRLNENTIILKAW
jgi:hypothetical protein